MKNLKKPLLSFITLLEKNNLYCEVKKRNKRLILA